MKINVFCCNFDFKTRNIISKEANINVLNIRSLDGNDYLDNSVILLSEHSLNKRLIRYIRSINVLTPIYIISDKQVFYSGINGSLSINNLTFQSLKDRISSFPQRNIWNFVFHVDKYKRIKNLNKELSCKL